MNAFTEKWDTHIPSRETVHANKIRMYLSRINKPLRKSNNDKGELKLRNHARVLTQLGDSWISNNVSDQLFIIDVLDPQIGIRTLQRVGTTPFDLLAVVSAYEAIMQCPAWSCRLRAQISTISNKSGQIYRPRSTNWW